MALFKVKSAHSNALYPLTADSAAANTFNGIDGALVKHHNGVLIVKILQVTGLQQCKEPYIVTVFQGNEVVSKVPLVDGEEDQVGSIRMPSQPIAIPIKGRSTRDFMVKVRGSLANPKWETEAVL